jgi:hypothetical protein
MPLCIGSVAHTAFALWLQWLVLEWPGSLVGELPWIMQSLMCPHAVVAQP